MAGLLLVETCVTGLPPTTTEAEELSCCKIGPGREAVDAGTMLLPGTWGVETSGDDGDISAYSPSREAANAL